MSGFDPAPKAKGEMSSLDLSAQLRAELERGERLLWTAQPIAARAMRAAFVLYIFAIPWTAFSLFWEAMALSPWLALRGQEDPTGGIQTAVGIVFPLFGLPFIAIGFWMLAKPFVAAAKARRTIYGLTDRRAVIAVFGEGKASEIESYGYEKMGPEMERKERADGSGSLYFAFKRTVDSDGDPRTERKGFEEIPSVREAESKLRRAVEGFSFTTNPLPD